MRTPVSTLIYGRGRLIFYTDSRLIGHYGALLPIAQLANIYGSIYFFVIIEFCEHNSILGSYIFFALYRDLRKKQPRYMFSDDS